MVHFDPRNKGQAGVSFYTPAQDPAAGSAADAASAPTLYKPLKLRSLELHNRFVVSPMCQYSADNGHLTDYHLVHLGQFALHGAGLVMVEATATEPRGRISPQDSGLWQDSQMEPLRRIVNYLHSQNTKAGIQLAHAGRKASTLAPWIGGSVQKALADEAHGGWPSDVVGPSPIPYAEDHAMPKELTLDEIQGLVKSFAESALRAVKAGFDMIEIHGAHGYLITEFLSPLSNKRNDDYGGSFENRVRFLREIIQAVRAVIPESMPLWLRISATEWMEHAGQPSWDLESSIKLAKLLPGLAREIRRALRADNIDLIIGAVGSIDAPEFARDVVQEGGDQSADLVLVARQFLREPDFVLNVAETLGVPVKWPNQYHMAEPKDVHQAFKL